MDKVIKCILIDVDNVLISEIVEMDAEIGDPNCKLINPLLFTNIDDMKPLKFNTVLFTFILGTFF